LLLRWLLLALCSLLGACASPGTGRDAPAIAPLQLESGTLTLADTQRLVDTPDLLAIDAPMREFVRHYTDGVPRGRARLLALHQAVRGQASLGIDYDPAAEGSAMQVFHGGRANCLSYATLFVALAREAGLEAHYQWLRVRPQWTVRGERIMVRLHVNALVVPGRSEEYMVDIDPLERRDIAGSRRISDRDAQALYHSNIGMEALAAEDLREAWLHSVRALQLSPVMPHLWVNLGAIYRFAGQHRDAEDSYLYALDLAPDNESAMNNLVVLYGIEGRDEERLAWERRVDRYRDSNPWYHAWLGDQAAGEEDWPAALAYYERAVALLPDDSRLLFAIGQVHFALDDPERASGYLRLAIEHATLRSDIDTYELQLRAIERALDSAASRPS
jgi:Flp pilus assembly protein TadD